MVSIDLPNGWKPRDYQKPVWRHFARGGDRAAVAWHRRAGKDDVALHLTACKAHERVAPYWHMLPKYAQARKAIWNSVNPHTGKRRIDEAFPKELRARTNEQEMFIEFRNGSTWQVVGSDSYDSLVGSTLGGVVFSEWALADPDAWAYLRPILRESGGWAFFISTYRGLNHHYRFVKRAVESGEWFGEALSAEVTGVLSPEDLEAERREYIEEHGEEDGEAIFGQEWLSNPNATVPGSYYGALLTKAKAQGRIGSFPYNPVLPVKTAWDIGVDDYTAVWFFQEDGRRVFAIDYEEYSGVGADTISEDILKKPYEYEAHFLPHDVQVREWGGGAKKRSETLVSLGVSPIRAGARLGPAERINASRRLLPVTHFHEEACELGIERLQNYKRKMVESLGVYSGPLHDEASHGSDAFGEFALNCPIVEIKPEPEPEKFDDYVPDAGGGSSSWL